MRVGAFYDGPIRWLSQTGITTGVGGSNRFAPDAPVTRGEMATFLARTLDLLVEERVTSLPK